MGLPSTALISSVCGKEAGREATVCKMRQTARMEKCVCVGKKVRIKTSKSRGKASKECADDFFPRLATNLASSSGSVARPRFVDMQSVLSTQKK